MNQALADVIADMTAAAAADTDVTSSAATLITTLLGEVQNGVTAGDLAQIQTAVDAFKANTAKMAIAVAQGSVPAPAPTPDPNAP